MLPAKYQPNPLGGSGEEDFWRVFTIFWHGGHLEFRITSILAIFRSPSAWMLHMKFGYIWPSGFRGEVIWKCGRTTEASHTISSPGAFGSGELIIYLTRIKTIRNVASLLWGPQRNNIYSNMALLHLKENNCAKLFWWMMDNLQFYILYTVFQSYQEDVWMKGYVQWNCLWLRRFRLERGSNSVC